MAERILAAFSQPFRVAGDMAVTVTPSIGVAMATAGVTPAELLRQADAALYHAKEAGRAQVAVFEAAMTQVPRLQLDRAG